MLLKKRERWGEAVKIMERTLRRLIELREKNLVSGKGDRTDVRVDWNHRLKHS